MSIVYHRPTPRTNWITALLIVLFVTGFGLLAEARHDVAKRDPIGEGQQHSVLYTAAAADRAQS